MNFLIPLLTTSVHYIRRDTRLCFKLKRTLDYLYLKENIFYNCLPYCKIYDFSVSRRRIYVYLKQFSWAGLYTTYYVKSQIFAFNFSTATLSQFKKRRFLGNHRWRAFLSSGINYLLLAFKATKNNLVSLNYKKIVRKTIVVFGKKWLHCICHQSNILYLN